MNGGLYGGLFRLNGGFCAQADQSPSAKQNDNVGVGDRFSRGAGTASYASKLPEARKPKNKNLRPQKKKLRAGRFEWKGRKEGELWFPSISSLRTHSEENIEFAVSVWRYSSVGAFLDQSGRGRRFRTEDKLPPFGKATGSRPRSPLFGNEQRKENGAVMKEISVQGKSVLKNKQSEWEKSLRRHSRGHDVAMRALRVAATSAV